MLIRRIIDYVRYNGEKWMTIQVYIYAAFYRYCMLAIPKTKLEKMLGIRGEESSYEETRDNIKLARLIGFHVNRVTEHTLWESKCLVKAMTARKLLKNHHVASTLYLGVGKVDGKMVAHAWLRCGNLYVTGGDGNGFGMVAKFYTAA